MRLEINGSFVLIDDEDAALVLGIKWYLHKAKQRAERYYAVMQDHRALKARAQND